jgi:predicted DNA-binding protein YlxM (UPF0122 family)
MEIAELFEVSHTAVMQWTNPKRQRMITDREWKLILALREGKARIKLRVRENAGGEEN